jgi:hypothetical protein
MAVGFLKSVRDVKRLTDHHGGMPSLRGGLTDMAKLADDRGEHEVLSNGVPARAVIKGFAEPVPGERFTMHVVLTVHPVGGAPYDVDHVFPTSRMKAAVTPGMEVPVKVHPDDPRRIAVQWDAQQASIAAAGGDLAAVTQGLQATYGQAADAAMRQAQANDPATKLQRLTQLRDSGLITDDEFTAKRAELLGDL